MKGLAGTVLNEHGLSKFNDNHIVSVACGEGGGKGRKGKEGRMREQERGRRASRVATIKRKKKSQRHPEEDREGNVQ